MTGTTLALVMQFCVMNYQDMYLYTMPNVNTNRNGWHFSERNPVAKSFQENGLASLYVAGTSAGVGLLADKLGEPWDRIVMAVAIGIEMRAIHSWAKFGLGPRECQWQVLKFDF